MAYTHGTAILRKAATIMVSLVVILFGVGNVRAFAAENTACSSGMSQLDCDALLGDWDAWVPDNCATSIASNNSAPDGDLSLSANQIAIARIIMGVAKTENLGQQGALIGLMVGLDESHLQIYANSGVPLSLNNPNKQAVGSDHDSLGVFQQRISTGWSTISNNPNDQAAVNQLMDPTYNAEAFFGSPPGSNAPHALSKGLQNVSGWQSLDPWVAAQKVQVSAFKDGSNYKAYYNQAQQLITKYWDDGGTVPVPLPIALTAATPSIGDNASSCPGNSSYNCAASGTATATDTTKILCEAQKYAGIWYDFGGGHAGRTAYVQGCPNPTTPPDNQPSGGPNGGNPSPCALDCSSLVSMAVDDAFGTTFDWTVADIVADHKHWQQINLQQAQPGDVVTVGIEHIEIFVSYDAGSKTIHTFGAHHTGTKVGPSQADQGYYDGVYRYIPNPTVPRAQ